MSEDESKEALATLNVLTKAHCWLTQAHVIVRGTMSSRWRQYNKKHREVHPPNFMMTSGDTPIVSRWTEPLV